MYQHDSLGSLDDDHFNGRDQMDSDMEQRIAMLFESGVPPKEEMRCGGPVELDHHLSGIEQRVFDCGSCQSKHICLIGLARNQKAS